VRGFIFVAVVLVAGCTQNREAHVKRVSLVELERETADLVYFNFVESDDFDYFTTPDERRFKVPANESRMAHRARSVPPQVAAKPRQVAHPGAGIALFVKLKEGRWVPPDPDKMRAMFPDTGLGPG
jgi:hypothetical protein